MGEGAAPSCDPLGGAIALQARAKQRQHCPWGTVGDGGGVTVDAAGGGWMQTPLADGVGRSRIGENRTQRREFALEYVVQRCLGGWKAVIWGVDWNSSPRSSVSL